MKLFFSVVFFLVSSFAYGQKVDTKVSEVTWTGSKITGGKHHGKMPIKRSDFKLNKKTKKIESGEIVFNVAKFTVDDLKGKSAKKFRKHMKSEDFFNAKKWPTAKLVINEMKEGKAKGLLTIKDSTQKVSFDYKEKNNVYTGDLKFDRTQYGMIYGSGNFFKNLGDKVINDEVSVAFKIKLKK